MIDVHCHILPDFDDGSSGMEESLEMARMAAASGITGIVTTPHFRGEEKSLKDLQTIVEKFDQLQSALVAAHIPITIYHGAEILCLPETPHMGSLGRLPTVGDTNYLLTEFYFDEPGSFIFDSLNQLAARGYRPLVAHPERYDAIQENLNLAAELFHAGFLLQINKGSVLGSFGSRVEQTAHAMLRQGLAHMIASDAHSCVRRTPHMGLLRQWASIHLDDAYTDILLNENPARLVQGREMMPV